MAEDTLPRHIPYGNTHKPFTVGLTALDPSAWLEPDADIDRYLIEKKALLEKDRNAVFRADPDSFAAQNEALTLISDHLSQDHPQFYQRNGSDLLTGTHHINIDDEAMPPLMRAGLAIQDDLAILMKRDGIWHLAAGFIAFPSSWSLAEKAGRAMVDVHANVPGFQAGTRNAKIVDRIFDNLQPDMPAYRFNWSFKGSASLAMPVSSPRDDDPYKIVRPIAANFLRVERQTLRRLPQTGAVLFTIRIYADPLTILNHHPDRSTIAAAMTRQLQAMKPEERAYKDMSDGDVEALCEYLAKVLR